MARRKNAPKRKRPSKSDASILREIMEGANKQRAARIRKRRKTPSSTPRRRRTIKPRVLFPVVPAEEKRRKATALFAQAMGPSVLNKHNKKQRKRKPKVSHRKDPKCMTVMELVREFPSRTHQVCFQPKVSTFNSVVRKTPRSRAKIATWL